MTTQTWLTIIGALMLGSIVYAWAADAVLGSTGFGVLLTSVVVCMSGYGGLLAMDWGISNRLVPVALRIPVGWVGAAIGAATLTLIVLCLCKRAIAR